MATILPVSDLRNYNTVLEHVSEGTPVYLTVNGRGRYIIRDIADENEYERMRKLLILMCELHKGELHRPSRLHFHPEGSGKQERCEEISRLYAERRYARSLHEDHGQSPSVRLRYDGDRGLKQIQ